MSVSPPAFIYIYIYIYGSRCLIMHIPPGGLTWIPPEPTCQRADHSGLRVQHLLTSGERRRTAHDGCNPGGTHYQPLETAIYATTDGNVAEGVRDCPDGKDTLSLDAWRMGPYKKLEPHGALWSPMKPYGSLWSPMEPYGAGFVGPYNV